MEYFIALGILLLILIGIMKVAGSRHYEDITEQEFEAEAKRGSSMGAAVGRLQEVIDPGHSTEHITEHSETRNPVSA